MRDNSLTEMSIPTICFISHSRGESGETIIHLGQYYETRVTRGSHVNFHLKFGLPAFVIRSLEAK